MKYGQNSTDLKWKTNSAAESAEYQPDERGVVKHVFFVPVLLRSHPVIGDVIAQQTTTLSMRRYRLRTLFVLMALCCLSLGVGVAYYRGVQRRWQDEAQLREFDAFLEHDKRGRIQKVPRQLIEWLNGKPTIVPVALYSPFAGDDPFNDQSDERAAFATLGDEHVSFITRCKWLERIELQGSQVIPAGIKILQAHFPNATIFEPNAPRLDRFELEMLALESTPTPERAITTD